MRERFLEKNLRQEKTTLIATADQIVSDYQAQGFRLTLRQLYYQFVSRNLIPNTERAYKNLGEAISDGRLCGLLDWEAIEDRIRVPVRPPEFDDLADLVEAALQTYRLPRWDGQEHYVELWVEKDALAGVLRPLAMQYHVTLMVNRGYSSQSAMYDAHERFLKAEDEEKSCVLLYLGDHDPSGEDMVRDIDARLKMFGCDVEVHKIALTMEQVTRYKPPPNPAKTSDSRAAGYIAEHGHYSWEVDALPPEVLQRLIRTAIERHADLEAMAAVVTREDKDKESLRKAVAQLMKKPKKA
jgi:hypothetical protein